MTKNYRIIPISETYTEHQGNTELQREEQGRVASKFKSCIPIKLSCKINSFEYRCWELKYVLGKVSCNCSLHVLERNSKREIREHESIWIICEINTSMLQAKQMDGLCKIFNIQVLKSGSLSHMFNSKIVDAYSTHNNYTHICCWETTKSLVTDIFFKSGLIKKLMLVCIPKILWYISPKRSSSSRVFAVR